MATAKKAVSKPAPKKSASKAVKKTEPAPKRKSGCDHNFVGHFLGNYAGVHHQEFICSKCGAESEDPAVSKKK